MYASIEDIPLTSPCQGRQAVEGPNSLREMGRKGKLNIRGDAELPAFAGGVKNALGASLPLKANTFSEYQSNRLFWLGPDEWLLHCDLDDTEELSARLNTELADVHHAVTDVSDYYNVIRLRGPDAVTLLRKGCPLDLHHTAFPSGNIAQTRFGHASILLHYHDDGETWDIQVRWSYAEYVWDYLVSGMGAL
jgi:sarcosine oxidase subunit gamma